MKIKLDENLPFQIARLLTELGHETHTVHDERLIGRQDSEIWDAAQRESRFLITQDIDFSDIRRFTPGSHRGILLVRLHSPNRQNLIDRIVELFQREEVVGWEGCFVVATERKIRVLRPRNAQTS